tara:strand:+ start:25 stop:645 length:621 start_codon:yes stop_codon:yes gene_type:complete
MPGRGIMRSKQRRAGSLGQGTRFYYLGAYKNPIAKVAGAQGFGKTNPSIGSMKSLGIMKQNRKAGGNNICKETQQKTYYIQIVTILSSYSTLPVGTLIYQNGTTVLLGVVQQSSGPTVISVSNPLVVNSNLSVTLVLPGKGFPGESGQITSAGESAVQKVDQMSRCGDCNGPKANCSNCSGRANVFNAITGGAGFSSTNAFTLLTH